jgi:pilus assembly protein CpaE
VSGPQAALRHKIDFTIVNDYPTVSAALNEGKTLAGIKVKSRVERDIRHIINALTTMIAIEANVL